MRLRPLPLPTIQPQQTSKIHFITHAQTHPYIGTGSLIIILLFPIPSPPYFLKSTSTIPISLNPSLRYTGCPAGVAYPSLATLHNLPSQRQITIPQYTSSSSPYPPSPTHTSTTNLPILYVGILAKLRGVRLHTTPLLLLWSLFVFSPIHRTFPSKERDSLRLARLGPKESQCLVFVSLWPSSYILLFSSLTQAHGTLKS